MATDEAVKIQHQTLEELRSIPYFKGFNPRNYPAYEDRYRFPTDYLDEIGLERIAEMVQCDLSLKRIATVLDVSSRALDKWISADAKRELEIAKARRFRSDELILKAEEALLAVDCEQDGAVALAGKLAEHWRWEASRLDKDLYGTQQLNVSSKTTASVVYNFNIGPKQEEKPVIEGKAKVVKKKQAPKTVDLKQLLTVDNGLPDFING